MHITHIEFKNLKLDIKEQRFKLLNFNYRGNTYSINIFLYDNDFYVYSFKEYISKIKVNEIIKGREIDLIFCQENLKDDNDLSVNTLISKYKLGVIDYYA